MKRSKNIKCPILTTTSTIKNIPLLHCNKYFIVLHLNGTRKKELIFRIWLKLRSVYFVSTGTRPKGVPCWQHILRAHWNNKSLAIFFAAKVEYRPAKAANYSKSTILHCIILYQNKLISLTTSICGDMYCLPTQYSNSCWKQVQLIDSKILSIIVFLLQQICHYRKFTVY